MMRNQIAHIDLKPTMEMIAQEGIQAPFSTHRINEADCALVCDVLDAYARVQYNLRLGMGVRAYIDATFTVPVQELNDSDVIIHALRLFESIKGKRTEYVRAIEALAVINKHRNLRHTLAHWLIRRSPLGDILIFFSTDIKQVVKQNGGNWKVERDFVSQDTGHAVIRVADLKTVVSRLKEASDHIGAASHHLMGPDV